MSEGKSRPIVQGLVLIVIGIVFLLGNFGVFSPDWEVVWTWMIIILGVIFWLGFLMDKSRDFLIMPGTILIIFGVVFYLIASYTWATVEGLWPIFILAPALGLYATYLISKKNRSVLITSAVIAVIGLIFLLNNVPVLKYIWPIITVAVGVYIIVNPEKKTIAKASGPDV